MQPDMLVMLDWSLGSDSSLLPAVDTTGWATETSKHRHAHTHSLMLESSLIRAQAEGGKEGGGRRCLQQSGLLLRGSGSD